MKEQVEDQGPAGTEDTIEIPRRDGFVHHVRASTATNVSAALLNQLADILDLPEDCCGISLFVTLDDVPDLTIQRRLIKER